MNRRGNVAVITALAMLPMVAAVGCAVDYSMASMIKTKLQAAADAASLATVSINSSVMTTAKSMSGSGTVSGGSTFATNYFNANLAQAPESNGYAESYSDSDRYQKRDNGHRNRLLHGEGSHLFHGSHGLQNIALSGTSTASYTLPTYIDFYLMLDVSGSMSFPSTTAEQSRLQAVNPDNYSSLSQRLHVCLPLYRARRLHSVGAKVRRATLRLHQRVQSKPGRILPGIYHLAFGDDAGDMHLDDELLEYHAQRYKLEQFAGQLLLHRRNDVVHPITRRCRRLCGDPAAVNRIEQRIGH